MKNRWFDYLFVQGGKWHDYLFSIEDKTADSAEKVSSLSAKQVIPFPSEIPVTAIENSPPVTSVAREAESEQSAANAAS